MIKTNKFIPIAEPNLTGNEEKYVLDCLHSGWISSLGKYIPIFEESFSKYCGARYGVSTANGTVALHLALAALGIKNGDEVIIPDLTFIATANAVTYTGAKSVLVDVLKETWNIDPLKIEEKITKKTKAIIVVHLYGLPCDMNPILKIAKKYHLYVIEDAAEAHGAEYYGKMVGSLGDIGCFSFYGNKTMTTGEGGMVITNNKKFAGKAEFLKDHAMSKKRKYYHPVVGFNYRMTNIEAAIGLAQLEKIKEFLAKKREIARLYNLSLRNLEGISLPPSGNKQIKSTYWMYSILVNKEVKISRDELIKELRKKNIDSRPFFIPLHRLPPYKTMEKFPVADNLGKRGLSLPCGVSLEKQDLFYISKQIGKIIN